MYSWLLQAKYGAFPYNQIKSNQIKSNQTKPNQTKPNQIKSTPKVLIYRLLCNIHVIIHFTVCVKRNAQSFNAEFFVPPLGEGGAKIHMVDYVSWRMAPPPVRPQTIQN